MISEVEGVMSPQVGVAAPTCTTTCLSLEVTIIPCMRPLAAKSGY